MKMTSRMSRRQFVGGAASAAALAAARPLPALAQAAPRFKIIGFSKPFAHLNFDDTADLVAEVGWDGIECGVRSKAGHIAPERVEEDLPKMVEALKKRDKELVIVATEITKIDPLAEKVLRTTAGLGIRNIAWVSPSTRRTDRFPTRCARSAPR